MNNRAARPGYYILFHATVDATGRDCSFTDAYYADNGVTLRGTVWYREIEDVNAYWSMVVKQLGVDDDHYSIAWCPSRNQAQKSAIKNWSNE